MTTVPTLFVRHHQGFICKLRRTPNCSRVGAHDCALYAPVGRISAAVLPAFASPVLAFSFPTHSHTRTAYACRGVTVRPLFSYQLPCATHPPDTRVFARSAPTPATTPGQKSKLVGRLDYPRGRVCFFKSRSFSQIPNRVPAASATRTKPPITSNIRRSSVRSGETGATRPARLS